MPKKCCVFACRTNYKDQQNDKISVYRFPKDQDERERWRKSIPNANLKVTDNTVICQKHWPSDFETIAVHGKIRPKNPPSVWPCVPSSQIPTTSTVPRSTKKTSSTVRNQKPDEMNTFLESDHLDFQQLKDCLINNKRSFVCPIGAVLDENVLTVTSSKAIQGIPMFLVKITEDLRFESFHYGAKCMIKSLSNDILIVDTGSKFEEIIRYLKNMDIDHKKNILCQHYAAMGRNVGMKYDTDIVIRAFKYYAKSRSLYEDLRKDFQFPSIRTLRRMTSKVSKLDEKSLLSSIFNTLDANQKGCIILHDEMYIQ